MLSRYYGGTMQRHAIATVIIMLAVLFSAAHAVERIPGLSRKPHFPPALTQDSKADSLTGFDVLEYEITLSINQATRQLNGNVAATVLAESHLTSLPYNLVGLNVLEVLVNDVPATYTHTNGIINISLDIPAG
ncbi:MAG: M1 family metallopeptidase, partial [Candidatus Cloacimonetes bacterium]|nr:M1 family metallopeptidase [Candidatus Cloacimonadota bacterium]